MTIKNRIEKLEAKQKPGQPPTLFWLVNADGTCEGTINGERVIVPSRAEAEAMTTGYTFLVEIER